MTADSSSLSRPPSPLPRALPWAAHTEEADKWSACSDKEAPGVTVGGALCPHYLSWPLHQLTPQLWFCFGFLFFFEGRGFKEMSMLCPTLVDQQTREETSQYFLEGRKEGERYYTTQPQTMSRTSMGIQGGRGGCLMRLPWGGGSRQPQTHLPLGWHARPCTYAHTGFTLGIPLYQHPKGMATPRRKPSRALCGMEESR